MELIKAIKKDESLVAEMDAAFTGENGFDIWWLGQSGFLVQWNGYRLLLDPYLSDSLTRKYTSSDKPHIRMSELVIRPELLHNISIVTSSHNHTDHLDAETLIPILRNNPGLSFVIPEANREFVAERVHCDNNFPIGVNDRKPVQIGAFSFYGIPAKHNEIERDIKGNLKYIGYIVAFGPFKIYHSGDTLWFDHMPELLKPFNIDVAFLPINGNDPKRGVAGNLDVKEAAGLAKAIGAKIVIPCHYDMFTFNTADPADFVQACMNNEQAHKVLKGGEKYTFIK
jgi:L-ascorbate metabolism protein UlaG (beta-lactamase superfamily)